MVVMDHSLGVRRAIIARLRADSALQALVGQRVYEAVPDAAKMTMPYIRYGVPIVAQFEGVQVDGSDIDVSLHVLDEGPDADRTYQIASELSREGLLAESDFVIAGGDLYYITWTGTIFLADDSAKRRHHAVVTFNVVTGQT